MTSPDGAIPDGSLAPGLFVAAQAQTEDDAKAQMTAQPVGSFVNAQDIWKAACQRQRMLPAELKDGQLALRHRIDLLNEVSAYGSAVMSHTWNIPYSKWCVLPFDTQLGPAKGIAVSRNGPETGFLTLKKGGLWRVDALFAVTGYSIGLNFRLDPNGVPVFYNTYSPIFPRFLIEVVDSSGALITAGEHDLVSDLALHQSGLLGYANAARSGAFSKTFVLPEMPPEDEPGAEEHWVDVRLAVRYEPIYQGVISDTFCQVLGGTQWCSLSATRWSRDSTHINHADTVPDGGVLG